MATLTTSNGQFAQTFTIEKQNGSNLLLSTANKYVNKDVNLTFNVKSATTAANTASADLSISTADATNTGGVNIGNVSGVVGTKATSEPTSGYYVAFTATGSGSSKVTAAGWVAAGALAAASTTSGVKYFPIQAAEYSVTGGGLTQGDGNSSLASNGYYNGSSYDTDDNVILTTTAADGYYKLTASGSGKVNRAAITKQNTKAGYLPTTSAATVSAATDLTSKTKNTEYFIKKSTLSASSITSSASNQTVTVYAGYYPTDRAITINKMTTVTPTTSYANTGMSTYFNTGTSDNNNVTITPQYSNSAGYVSAHTDQNNGGIGYWKIKTTSVTQGTTTVSGTTATRGNASWGTGWITSSSIAAATFSNSATSGVTYVDISNTTAAPILAAEGYLYINKGYTDNLRISLAKLIPDSATVSASNQMLNGVAAYDSNGKLWTGNIQTKTGSDLSVNGKTVTVPAGYYAQAYTKDVAVGTIKSGSASITSLNYNYDAENFNFAVTGSATVSAPTVPTAGYVSSSEGTKQTNTASVSTSVARIKIKAAISGTAKVTPTISKVTDDSGNSAVNITDQVGTGTTTKPTAANTYYVAVKSSAAANNITATPSVVTAGYGTTSQYETDTAATLSVGANASAVTYFTVAAGSCTVAGGVLSTSGYSKSDLALTLASGSSTNMANITTSGAQALSGYDYYFKINGSTPAVSGTTSASVTAITDAHTAGYIPAKAATNFRNAQSASPSVSVNATSGSIWVHLKKATMTVAGTNTVSPSASLTASNVTYWDTNNGISVTATGGGTASVTATATTNAAGYAPASTQLGSATLSAANKTTTATKYLKRVKIPVPSSGTNIFEVEVPNGNTTDTIVFQFQVDSSGNVYVMEPD